LDIQIPLLEHQQITKDFILSHPYCGIYLKMGLGKTLATLAALYDLNPSSHVLVSAPYNIARSTWLNEIRKWNLPFRCKSLIVNDKGKKLSREKRIVLYATIPNEQPTMWFINRELLCDLIHNMPTGMLYGRPVPIWPFQIVILDESQSYKSHASVRFKALQKVRPQMQRVIELSGTPKPKGIEDMWSQIYLLDQGYRLGKNITAFRNYFMHPTMVVNGHSVGWKPNIGAEDEVHRRIADITMSLENSSMYIPPITYNNIDIFMDDDEMKLYKRLKKELVLDIGDIEVIAANAGVLSVKLSQMASGALYTDDKRTFHVIHTHKLEMCEYIVNNANDNVIIAYHFHSDKYMLLDYFKQVDIPCVVFDGSPEMQDAWNHKQIPVMLAQPASTGHGLNIQDGGHTLVWYTIPTSLEEYQQCNARLWRQGQNEPVIIHHLLTYGTIDHRLLRNNQAKDASQRSLLDAVRLSLAE